MISAYLRRRQRQLRQQRQTARSFRIEPLEQRVVLTGFTAYNGVEASALTDPNTTFYGDLPGRDAAGPLWDVVRGVETSVLLTTSQTGVVFDTKGSNPPAGTDAHEIFDGFVDFAIGDQRSYEIEPNAAYQYTFENLDSGATYQFAGTVIRGNNAYTDRWTLIELEGADSFTPAHSTGTGVVTNSLQPNQVAIWAGDNSTQGYVAQWKDITAGDDGVFHVVSTQYLGAILVGSYDRFARSKRSKDQVTGRLEPAHHFDDESDLRVRYESHHVTGDDVGRNHRSALGDIAHRHPAYFEIETGLGGEDGALFDESPQQAAADGACSCNTYPDGHRRIVPAQPPSSRAPVPGPTLPSKWNTPRTDPKTPRSPSSASATSAEH